MKRTILLLGLIVCYSLSIHSQNKVLKQIIERPDLNKEQIYNAAKEWYHLEYNHSIEDIIIEENEEKGKLLYKIWNRHSATYNGSGTITCIIEITVKNGKTKFIMQDITHKLDDVTRPSMYSIQEQYDLKKGEHRFMKRNIEQILPEIEEMCEGIKKSFVEYINNYKPKSFDW